MRGRFAPGLALLLVCALGCGVYAPARWPDAETEVEGKAAVGEEREDGDGA